MELVYNFMGFDVNMYLIIDGPCLFARLPINAGCPIPIIPLKRSPLFFACSFLGRWSEMIVSRLILQLLLLGTKWQKMT